MIGKHLSIYSNKIAVVAITTIIITTD